MHLEFADYKTDRLQTHVQGRLTAYVEMGTLPEDVAFEVVAMAAGKEYPLGLLCCQRGQEYTSGEVTCRYDGPSLQSVDLVLRSGPGAAHRTIDLTDVWQGDLVYRDVPILPLDPEKQAQD